MARFKKIALFADGYYAQLPQLLGLQRGFQQIGIECFAGWPLPPPEQMDTFVQIWQPDVVFEFDRTRGQLGDCVDSVLHVGWIQNHRNFGAPVYAGAGSSDLHYADLLPERYNFDTHTTEYKWLLPGADETVFYPKNTLPYLYDFNLCGYMFMPLSDADINQSVVINGIDCGKVVDYIAAVHQADLLTYQTYDVRAIHEVLLSVIHRTYAGMTLEALPDNFKDLFDGRLFRTLNRKRVVDGMLAVSQSVALCGGQTWAAWPKFAPHYRGNITNTHELADIYRQTRISVHDSLIGMHHRTMEVMACGRALMVNHASTDGSPIDIANYFTPGEDFIWYDPENFAQTAREALADPAQLERIGQNAHRKIHDAHLWRHRAQQIVRDIGEI